MSGRIFMRDGSLLYLGEPPDASIHRKCIPLVQIVIPIEGSIEARFEEEGVWEEIDGVVVASDVYHQYQGECSLLLSLWLNPTSEVAQIVVREGLREESHRHLAAFATQEVRRFVRAEGDFEDENAALDRIFSRVVEFLRGGGEERVSIDERIARAMELLKSEPLAARRLDELAAEVGLSPRHFRQLFLEHFGTSCKRHLQWRRMARATGELITDASLTEIAHNLGFTDASHFTRVYRDLFGVPPSNLRGMFEIHGDLDMPKSRDSEERGDVSSE